MPRKENGVVAYFARRVVDRPVGPSKFAKDRGLVLLPAGEGGPAKHQEKGRMRAKIDAFPTLTRRSAPPSPEGRGTRSYITAKLKSTPHRPTILGGRGGKPFSIPPMV